MRNGRFKNFQQFQNEVLRHWAGPLVSPVEDMADEMFHSQHQEEFESLWDSAGGDDD